MAFFDALGVPRNEHPMVVGMLSQDEVIEGLEEGKIDGKAFSLIQKGLTRSVARICRLISGAETKIDGKTVTNLAHEAKAAEAATQSSSTHLKQVISQGSEETVVLLCRNSFRTGIVSK